MDATTVTALARLLPALLLLGVALVIVKRWSARSAVGSGLRTLMRTGLTRNASVAVVDAGSRRFLLGVADGGVSLLAELDPDEPLTAPATPVGAGAPSFARRLRELTGAPTSERDHEGATGVPLR